MYVVEKVGADTTPALSGPFRAEQSALDFAARLAADARVVELKPPVLGTAA
jgi:hypothetical protein